MNIGKKYRLATVLTFLFAFTFVFIGWSSSKEPIKPAGTDSDKTVLSISPPQIKSATEGISLTFPATSDISLSCTYQNAAYHTLAASIRLYRRVTGTYPESMSSFVRSGFPLHWPRNVMTGAPVGVLTGRDFNLDKTDWGLIKWEKFNDDNAKLTFVNLDTHAYRDEGTEKWIVNYIEFKWRDWESYKDETMEDYRNAFKAGLRPGDDVKEKAIDIIGGTIPVNDVSSDENRMIYGMCAQLHHHICGAATDYYCDEKHYTVPSTFTDFYSGFQDRLGVQNEHSLIIRENFTNFARLLKTSDADFKIGFNKSKNTQYTWLKTGDETLIAFCRMYNPNTEYGIGSQYLGVEYNAKGDRIDQDYFVFKLMADMSSPMITANNLDQIDIPNEIAISIEDIPLGE